MERWAPMSKRLLGSLVAAAGLGIGLLAGPLAMDAGAQPRAASTSSSTTGNCAVIPLPGGLDVIICVSITT